jgi:hypothetical protein
MVNLAQRTSAIRQTRKPDHQRPQAQLAALTHQAAALPALLGDGLRAAVVIVQWAQGNYDPETVRGWPHAELRKVAEVLKAMPGVTDRELEWIGDVRYYADMAEAVERARKLGRQKELNQIPRAAIGSGGYAGQVEQILQAPPKPQSEPEAAPTEPEKAPEQPPTL